MIIYFPLFFPYMTRVDLTALYRFSDMPSGDTKEDKKLVEISQNSVKDRLQIESRSQRHHEGLGLAAIFGSY